MTSRSEKTRAPNQEMAGLVGEYPDLDILVNAAENGSIMRESNKGSDVDGAFDPEEYAELVQQCTEKSQSVQQQFSLEYQKQKLAQENEAALLEALQQSLTKIESDHFSDFANLSSSLEQCSAINSDTLTTKTDHKKGDVASDKDDSVLKKLLLSSSNKVYPKEQNNSYDKNNNTVVRTKSKEMPSMSEKQNKPKPKLAKKKPFTELLKHLEGAQSVSDKKTMSNVTTQKSQVKKVGTRLVNTVRYMQKYSCAAVAKEAPMGLFATVKTEIQSPEKNPVQKTIYPPISVVTIPTCSNLKRRSSFQSNTQSKFAKIVVAETKRHTKNIPNIAGNVTPSTLRLSEGAKPNNNQSSVTTISQEKADQSTKVVKWEDYLNRVRLGIRSAPNSPTTSPRSVRGSARPSNNFMLVQFPDRNTRGPVQVPPLVPKKTKLVSLPEPLCKTQTTRKNVPLQKFEEYLNKLNRNLAGNNNVQNSKKISVAYVPSDFDTGVKPNKEQNQIALAYQGPSNQANNLCQKLSSVSVVQVSITPTFVASSQTGGCNATTINSISAGSSGSVALGSCHPLHVKLSEPQFISNSTDGTTMTNSTLHSKAEKIKKSETDIKTASISLAKAEALCNDITTIHNYCTTGPRLDTPEKESTVGLKCDNNNALSIKDRHTGTVSNALASLVAILNATQIPLSQECNSPAATIASSMTNSDAITSLIATQPNTTTVTQSQNVAIDREPISLGSHMQTLGSQENSKEKYGSEESGKEPIGAVPQSEVTYQEPRLCSIKNVPSSPLTNPFIQPECSNIKAIPEVIPALVDLPNTSKKEEFKTKTGIRISRPEQENIIAPSSPKTKPPLRLENKILKSTSSQAEFSMTRSMAAAEMLATDVVEDGGQDVLVYKEPSSLPNKPQAPTVEDPDPAVILLDDAISSLENDVLLNGAEPEDTSLSSATTKLYCKLPSYFMTGKLDTEIARKNKSLGEESGSNDETVGYNKLPHYFSSGKRVRTPRNGKRTSPVVDKGAPVVKLDPASEHLAASGNEIFYSRLPSYYSYGRPHPELRTFNDSVADNKDDTVTPEQIETSAKLAQKEKFEASKKLLQQQEEKQRLKTPREILYSKIPSYYTTERAISGRRCYNDGSDTYSDSDSPESYRSRRRSRRKQRKSRSHRSRSHHRKRSLSRSRSRSSSLEGDSRSFRRCSRSRKEGGKRNRVFSRGRSRDERREQMKHQQAMEERRVVYIGRIARSTTKGELRHEFIRFGNIEAVSLHFREEADNYGFITFEYACDAFRAIEEGNRGKLPHEEYELSFGGRRQFCGAAYQDLDSKTPEARAKKAEEDDFDALLRQARRGLR